MKIISPSSEKTKEFASSVAERFKNQGGVIALMGDLGSGKTTFTQGFAKALQIEDKIMSPTFTLIRQHHLPDNRTLYHLDLYRLEKINIHELGLADILSQPNDIVLIEWAEKLGSDLPKNAVIINFKHLGENVREIEYNDF